MIKKHNQLSWKNQRPGAFTLIELLVVVAIIVLLIAILLPALRGARQFAGEINCRSNLSQLTKAWHMYFQSYNGACYQRVNANLNYGGWKGTLNWSPRPLNPYLNLPAILELEDEAKVFRCPGDNGGVPGTSQFCSKRFGTSYQTNILLIGQDRVATPNANIGPLYREINRRLERMNVSRVADPSHLILIGDYGWVNQWMPGMQMKTEWHDKPGYHTIAFLDGHVEQLRIRKGLYITPNYRIQPLEELDDLTIFFQKEEP